MSGGPDPTPPLAEGRAGGRVDGGVAGGGVAGGGAAEADSDGPQSSSPPSTRGKTLLRKVLVFTILGGLVFAGLSLYGDVSALAANLSVFRWEMLALAVALASGNYALRYVRWHYYLRRIEVEVPHAESALIFLSGFVMSVTPGKVGEVFKSLLLYESRGHSIVKTAPVVIAERLTDLIALVLLTALGALSFEQGPAVTLVGGVVVLGLLIGCAVRPVAELGIELVRRLPFVGRLAPRLREAYESLFALTRPAPLLVATALSTAAWALEVVALGAVVAGFEGVHLGWEATTFAYAASTIAGAVAMMPGGLGVTEAGMTGLLEALGGQAMTPAVATAATMLTRIATLWWAVLVGLAALPAYRALTRNRLKSLTST